jgi:hexosaminidase
MNINVIQPVKTQYVKVVALSESKMPAWHGGKDSPAFCL